MDRVNDDSKAKADPGESLLWRLSQSLEDEEAEGTTALDDEVVTTEALDGYRAGALNAKEAQRVEQALLADPSLRRRWLAESGLDLGAPAELRERTLGAQVGRRRSVRSPTRWIAAAALLIVSGLAVLSWLSRSEAPSPAGQVAQTSLEYEVSVFGEAAVRGPSQEENRVRVLSTTRVRLEAEAVVAVADVHYSLFREGESKTVRVPARLYSAETRRGAGLVEFEVGDLLASTAGGAADGEVSLWLLVSRTKAPSELEIESGTRRIVPHEEGAFARRIVLDLFPNAAALGEAMEE